jgi:hypothetical protein
MVNFSFSSVTPTPLSFFPFYRRAAVRTLSQAPLHQFAAPGTVEYGHTARLAGLFCGRHFFIAVRAETLTFVRRLLVYHSSTLL